MITRIPNPQTKKFTQPNQGEIFGSLWATFNVDLNLKKGKISPSNRTYVLIGSDDDADLGYPVACVRSSADSTDRYWSVCNTVLFRSADSTPTSAFTQDAIAGSPTDLTHLYSDAIDFEGSLIATSTDDVHKLSSGTWDTDWWSDVGGLNQANLTASVPHPLDVFERVLLIGDANLLHTIDRNYVVSNSRLKLPSFLRIRAIEHNQDRIWIGCQNTLGGDSAVVEWDGFSETYNKIHWLKGDIVFNIPIKGGVPHALTNAGILYKNSGSTFTTEAYLPVFSEDILNDGPSSRVAVAWEDSFTLNCSSHWNGWAIIDDKIHILISGGISGVDTQLLDNMKGGIWCYDSDFGFYHRFGLSKWRSSTERDFATEVIHRAGFLIETHPRYGKFLAGAGIYKDNVSAELKGIFVNDTGEGRKKRGYFITTQVLTSNVRDLFDKFVIKFKKLRSLASTDGIVVKTMGADSVNYNFPFRAAITWTADNTFTSTDSNWANVASPYGEEIEVIIGNGAGTTAHVSSVSYSAPTYTITIDESIPTGMTTSPATAQVRVSKWTKRAFIDSTTKTYDGASGVEDSQWAQFKVELRGQKDSPEFEELQISMVPKATTDK